MFIITIIGHNNESLLLLSSIFQVTANTTMIFQVFIADSGDHVAIQILIVWSQKWIKIATAGDPWKNVRLCWQMS